MNRYSDMYPQFMFPGMYRPASARTSSQHACAYDDPYYDQYLARSLHPGRQTFRDKYANSAYEDHLRYGQPPHFNGYHEPQQFPYAYGLDYSPRRAPHRHLAESDPGHIDLRFLPAFALSSGVNPPARQQRPSEHGSPCTQSRSTARQVPIEDASTLHYDALTSQFPFLLSRHENTPSMRASSWRAASCRSKADSDEDLQVEQPQDLTSEKQRLQHLKHQQQAEEQLLRQKRALEEREHRLAQQAKERELWEEREHRLAQTLHEQHVTEEQERRRAYQHMQEERLKQLFYQKRWEQELAEGEQRQLNAAQMQHCLQQQRQEQQRHDRQHQEQQRQQQIAEALLQRHKQEESQRRHELNAALLQQQQQQKRCTAQKAAPQHFTEEQQKSHQQLQKDRGEMLSGRVSVQQPADEAATIIHKLMRSNSVHAERPMLEQLSQANVKLIELSEGLKDVASCVSALQSPESGLPAKLKHCQGQLESPEQLQKRLVELGERCMQVVLSMDELHSENDKVRSLRKRIVKKALALMEDVDNVKSNMLHSILVHANDDQSEFSMPPSGAVSEASETAEEDAEEVDVKHESQNGLPAATAVGDPSQGDRRLQQVAEALAGLKMAEEAVPATAAEQRPNNAELDRGNDGEVRQNHEADNAESVIYCASGNDGADTA